MNKDSTKFLCKISLATIILLFIFKGLAAQTQLNLTNDTRANGLYCDSDGKVFYGCGSTFSDDGGVNLYSNDLIDAAPQGGAVNNYGDDSFEPIFWTFCPNNPSDERIRLTFTEFDIHSSDQFLVYDGDCEIANGDKNPNIGTSGQDDDNALDFDAMVQLAGGSPGQMTQVAGDGTVLFGAGWVEASCANISGCITIGWNPNGDNNKGLGWLFTTSCVSRYATITCPTDIENNGKFPYDGLTIGCGTNLTVPVPSPNIGGCALGEGGNLLSPYMIQVEVDGQSLGYVGGNLSEFPEMTIGVGRHIVTYTLFFDKDGDGDPFDGELVENRTIACEFTAFDSEDLVCNSETNISLGDDCATILAPKDILCPLCGPAFPLRIVINSKTYTSLCYNCDFEDLSGNKLELNEGIYEYIIRDGCNNACFGNINLRDIQIPQCVGPTFTTVLCAEPIPSDPPLFLDCNEIETTNYVEFEYGACGQYSTAEVNALQSILNFDNFEQTSPGVFVLSGSGTTIISSSRMLNINVESITLRQWRATDSNGNTNENCPQAFLNIRPDSLYMPNTPTIEVKCGEDITPEGLSVLTNSDGSLKFSKKNLAPWFIYPTDNQSTDSIAFLPPGQENNCHFSTFYEDQIIQTLGSTQKIARTWTWLDWCAANPQRTEAFVQVIKIVDDSEPVLAQGPDTLAYSIDLFDCVAGEINLSPATWSDECGEVVAFRTELRTVLPNGGIGSILQNNTQNGGKFLNLNVGNYYALYYAEDEDGNETSSFGTGNIAGNVHIAYIKVVDGVKPQARCINQLNISLRSNQDRIEATDFNAGSSDNCGIASLEVSLSDEAGSFGPFINISCSDINKTLRVYLQAVDVNGNKNVCWGDIKILNHEDNISCGGLNQMALAGEVINSNGEFLGPVSVTATSEGQAPITVEAQFGLYNLNLPVGRDYLVAAEKNIFPSNGVSTFDLVLMSQHILSVKKFTSPYQYIAADINKSGTITSFDMLQVRQLILNKIAEFPSNSSWRFIDAQYNFGSDISSTLSQNFRETIAIQQATESNIQLDFIGVKIGDVNGTAIPNKFIQSEPRNGPSERLNISTTDKIVEAGNEFLVSFNLEQVVIDGFQFTMDYKDLELLNVEGALLQAEHINADLEDRLLASWNGTKDKESKLFTLKFKALKDGRLSDMIDINSAVLSANAYSIPTEETFEIGLTFDPIIQHFELLQSLPNPTKGKTTIGFVLPQESPYVLRIMDFSGKELVEINGIGNKGLNQVIWDSKTTSARGFLYYQLQTPEYMATKKLMIIK